MQGYMIEAAYELALEGIAMGATRSEVWGDVTSSYPGIDQGHMREAMKDALSDALRQGVEREDIDPSWF